MNKTIIIGLVLALSMAFGAAASSPSWDAGGWTNCLLTGTNYGNLPLAFNCLVAWDPIENVCEEGSRDALIEVGNADENLLSVTFEYLDGIAETGDSFEIRLGDEVLCTVNDPVFGGPSEVWQSATCDLSDFNLVGVQTLTFHPTAEGPWSLCSTYGQVAVKDVTYSTSRADVPEFGVIAASIAMIGAVGIIIMRRH